MTTQLGALRAELYEFLEQISLTPGSDWDGAREDILSTCHGFLDKLTKPLEAAANPDTDGGYVRVKREVLESALELRGFIAESLIGPQTPATESAHIEATAIEDEIREALSLSPAPASKGPTEAPPECYSGFDDPDCPYTHT